MILTLFSMNVHQLADEQKKEMQDEK